MNRMNFTSKISGVEFYPISDEEIRGNAAVVVTNKNQFTDKGPEPHGIYDSRTGTIYSKYDCATCNQGIRKCPGHYGTYDLKYPLCYIITISTVIKFLKITCVHCNRFIMDPSKPEYKYTPMQNTDGVLDVILATKIKQGDKKKKIFCDYCNEDKNNITLVQPKYISKSANEQNNIKVKAAHDGKSYKYTSSIEYERTMYSYEILRLFEGVSNSELEKFGIPLVCHPRHFYTRQLFILPANMRFINNDNKNSYSNQHTACIEKIIKVNSEIPGEIPSKKDTAAFSIYISAANRLVQQYIEYIKVKSNNDVSDTILQKIKGKKGLTRQSQLAKNVGKVFRVVIVCDTDCPINTIKLPKWFAMVLTVDETVTEYNLDRLTKIFNNGPNYPGYNEITSVATGKKYDSRNTSYKLQIGDTLHRHIIDGDTVPFHRFPTLTGTCTTTMRIVVHKDSTSAVAFNVLACDLFNADYDGDTMMGFLIGHEGIRCEANYVMNMDNGYNSGKVSPSNAFILGQVLDSVVGFALITRNFVRFTRYQVMNLIRDVQIDKLLTQEIYTGREVMSLVLPPIQYKAPSSFFANKVINQFLPFRKPGEKFVEGDTRFDESDMIIDIENGIIKSGMVCGNAIKGSPGSIYHLIYDQYGSKMAHKIIFYHQQITKRYLELECFSIGHKDLVLEQKAHDMINLTQSRLMAQLKEIENRILNKNIVPPLGKNIKTYVDELVLNIHSSAENAYLVAILQGCKPHENGFFVSSLSGAKGKMSNIYNMFAPLGQIKIDGKRIASILDFQRYNLFYPQFSMDPGVGGYVSKSYISGIPPKDMYTVCKNARSNVLTKGLVVGEAGATGRDLIKVKESLYVDNRGFTVRNKGENIIEFAVADDGFESSTIISNDYFIIAKSEKDIRDEVSAKKFIDQPLAKKLVDQIVEDRNEFIKIQKAKEVINYAYECTKTLQTPFNIKQLIYVVTGNREAKPSLDEYKDMLHLIDEYVQNVHYIKINPVHRAKKTKLLRPTELTMTAVRILLRLYFNPAVLEKFSYKWLDTILNNINVKILEVLYAPGKNIGTINGQTLSAPLTQYLIDAHAQSTTGGTSRDGLKYFKQVASLKPIAKLTDASKRMYIFLKEKYEENEQLAQNLAEYIGTIQFNSFIISLEVLAEKYGECITYPSDKKIYNNPTISAENKREGLYPFVFRYTLNTDKMESKNVTIMQIVNSIEKYFNGMVYCVYSHETGNTILHLYFNNKFTFVYQKDTKAKRGYSVWERIVIFADKFNNGFIINEFSGITSVYVRSRNKTIVNEDGSLGKKRIYYLLTNGINMRDVLLLNVVDKQRTSCSHIQETFDYFGIIAARDKFISEVSNTFITLKLSPNNFNFPANIMFERGYPANLAEKGQKIREPQDPLLHSAFKNPINAIRSAVVNNVHNNLSSPSANLMMGRLPELGTSYNTLVFNFDFLENKKANKIEDLL